MIILNWKKTKVLTFVRKRCLNENNKLCLLHKVGPMLRPTETIFKYISKLGSRNKQCFVRFYGILRSFDRILLILSSHICWDLRIFSLIRCLKKTTNIVITA